MKAELLLVLVFSFLASTEISGQDKPPRKRLIERAKRPTFTERDWDGIYFDDLFTQGLVGNRPENFGRKTVASPMATPSAESGNPEMNSGSGWSQWISSSAIEDEIKNTHLELEKLITTAQNFKTDNAKVRASFSRLSTWFAIVAEFDDSVRWQGDAAAARDAFAKAAANAQTSSDEAFASVKSQRDQLGELIRGGKFSSASASSDMAWPNWVDRVSLMTRLDQAITERIKPWTSNQSEFANHGEEILHEANIVAATGHALVQTGLDDVEEEDYQKFAQRMSAAAKSLQEAIKANQFEAASTAANQIGQACSDCHEAFR